MDAEVYWQGRLVGHLRNIVIDQPYYRGNWSPSGDAGFEQAYRALQAEIAPDGLGVLPVMFRSPDGVETVPYHRRYGLRPVRSPEFVSAAAMVRPAPEPAPYFRFGHEGMAAAIVHRPTCEPGRRWSPLTRRSRRSGPSGASPGG